ncbi:uncharacterized protein LOC141689471 [Apium graveolens]|uniref:uncharacterized protein LOC141689471 n=1 Tax=Apium graveolens TaxID=4045 RepID=UPI003D78CD6B
MHPTTGDGNNSLETKQKVMDPDDGSKQEGKGVLTEGEGAEFEGEDGNYDSDSSESSYDNNGDRMTISSCDEEEIKYPEFNENTDMEDPQFELGMLFSSGKVFKEAVRKLAITQQRGIRLNKNLVDKIKWICVEGCQWKCYGIKQQRLSNIQIRTLYKLHTCNPIWVQKQLNSTWIARAYEHEIKMNPTWPTYAFHAKVVNDLQCHVSEIMVYRALRKAKDAMKGCTLLPGHKWKQNIPQGLINALESHFPESEHRFCVMHLYNNMKSISNGFGISKTMWQATRSTTDYFFNMNMKSIKKRQWHCHYVQEYTQDLNAEDTEEEIKNGEEKYSILAIKLAGKATPVWNGGDKYHVTMLAGGHEKMDPLDFIHQCYSKETYLQVYSHILEPISGEAYWEQTEQEEPLLPLKRTPPGRPKKARVERNDVVPTRANNPTMLKRQETTLRCSHCGQWEHNVRSCPRKQAEEAQGEGGVNWQPKTPKCSYCLEEGHNMRSCTSMIVDIKKKKKDADA